MEQVAIITKLEGCAPGFRAYAHSDDNFFGVESVHGIFAAFADHVRAADGTTNWQAVAEYVNAVVDEAGGELDNAACTGFLENLAQRGHPLERHLVGPARIYWDCWC